MIYDLPDIRDAGDRHLLAYFGDELNLDLNFTAQALGQRITEAQLPGIVDLVPHFASLMVQYDPDAISRADLETEMVRLAEGVRSFDEIVLDSRLVSMPVVFFDPWTRDCIADYCRSMRQKEFDVDLLVRINQLSGPDELKAVYSATEHWVTSVGFRPGLPMFLPLDPRSRLKAPKYDPPRTWTPRGAVGIGGAAMGLYAAPSAGGYQLFGRTPWPAWDIERRYPPFHENACLFRPGDRLRIVPISLEEYAMIEARLAEGSYVFNIVSYQKFSVGDYKKWLTTIDVGQRLRTP